MHAESDCEALIQFLYMAPVGLVQASTDGEILLINPVSAQLLMPLSTDGGLSNLFTALDPVAPDLRHRATHFEADHGMVCEALCLQVDAGVRGVRDPRFMSLTLMKLDPERLMAVITDVTAQVKRDKLLRQNEAWLKAIFTGISDYAIMKLDRQGRVVEWNPSIGRVTGFTRDDTLEAPYSMFYPPGAMTPDRLLDRLREADENGWSLDDGWRVRSDGTNFWGSAMIAPLPEDDPSSSSSPSPSSDADADAAATTAIAVAGVPVPVHSHGVPLPIADDVPAYCLVIRDITDKREATETLRRATSCDHLTGLANRRAFFEAAELEIGRWHRSPRELTLLLFDIDHFKAVNDTHGHPAGDTALRRLADAMTATFRNVDVIARVGGEEFAVLLPSTDAAGALAVADRLRVAVAADAVIVGDAVIRYTISGGVAVMEDGVTGLDMLMKRADEALYAAKRGGRNRIARWTPARAAPVAIL